MGILDGNLREMNGTLMKIEIIPRKESLSAETLNAIKKLVAEECANWLRKGPSGTKDYCGAKEKSNGGVCVLFGKPLGQCHNLEQCVLPLAQDLAEDYFKTIEEERNGEPERLESSDIGGGAGEGTGSSQVVHVPAETRGVSVGQHIKKAILPRHSFHGVGIVKEAPEGGREVGDR